MSTTVVYAQSSSGYISSNDATYLNAARGDGTFSSWPGQSTGWVGQTFTTSYYCQQTFLSWDTSAVGGDTVSAVALEVDGNSDGSTTDFLMETYAFTFGSITNADFRDSDVGIPALGSIIASYDTSGGWDTGTGYNNDLGANANFNSAINGSGNTEVVIISQEQRNESQPSGSERVQMECTGNTNDARLTITHSSGGASATGSPTLPALTMSATAQFGPTLTYAAPDADITTTGWATAPLWSKVDEDPDTPDGTVITGAS